MRIISNSEEETFAAGEQLGKKLSRGNVVLLTGDLGAGKTRFVKGIARGLGIREWWKIRSPTFSFRQSYTGEIPLYHFDFYRLKDIYDFETIGIDPLDLEGGVVVIEWGEKYAQQLKNFFDKKIYSVKIEILDENRRMIEITEEMEEF